MTSVSPEWMGLVGVINWPSSARTIVARPVRGPTLPDWNTLGAVAFTLKLKFPLTPRGCEW